MFTGLVEALGTVVDRIDQPPGIRLVVEAGIVADDAAIGASICVSGCCLSVVGIEGSQLAFELGPETLVKTGLGAARSGSRVNLERSLKLSDRLGGHLVTGHVDAVGRLETKAEDGGWVSCRFWMPAALGGQVVPKGSIAVDGVSLTVVDVFPTGFSVALIPHTLAETTLGGLVEGDGVNLETDLVGKYVTGRIEAWLAAAAVGPPATGSRETRA